MLRLVGVGVGVEEFQWSEDEQVWPFEKTSDGDTLYCKEIDFGPLPDTGAGSRAHGIPNLDLTKVEHLSGMGLKAGENSFALGYPTPNTTFIVQLYITETTIQLLTARSWTGWNAKIKVIYSN